MTRFVYIYEFVKEKKRRKDREGVSLVIFS